MNDKQVRSWGIQQVIKRCQEKRKSTTGEVKKEIFLLMSEAGELNDRFAKIVQEQERYSFLIMVCQIAVNIDPNDKGID